MIGVLVITHGNLGSELIRAAEQIKGSLNGALHISVGATKGLEDLRKEITAAIRKLDTGMGVLVLTDLFGGTPSNVSLAFLKEGKVEVVTGVNSPCSLRSRMRGIRRPICKLRSADPELRQEKHLSCQ